MSAIVECKDITVKIGSTVILEKISLAINKNDFLGVIGPNGGGKSTLLKVLLGLQRPNEGSVKLFGKNPGISLDKIGYMPQRCMVDLSFPITVYETVLLGCVKRSMLLKRFGGQHHQKVAKALKFVGMEGLGSRNIGELSEGQRQRVFLARALVDEPELLLLDEPTASIDTSVQGNVYSLLKSLNKKITIILVTHDIGVISSYVDKIACLNVKLHYHGGKELTPEDLERTYHCPVEMISHGKMPHRVVKEHK